MELTKEVLKEFFKNSDEEKCYKKEVYLENIDPSENDLAPDKVKKLLNMERPKTPLRPDQERET